MDAATDKEVQAILDAVLSGTLTQAQARRLADIDAELVTDFWAAYNALRADVGDRQCCLAHLLRELEKVDQRNQSARVPGVRQEAAASGGRRDSSAPAGGLRPAAVRVADSADRSPPGGLPKAEEAEPARKRRALTEDEITRLLKAAQERPLRDALTIRRGRTRASRWRRSASRSVAAFSASASAGH